MGLQSPPLEKCDNRQTDVDADWRNYFGRDLVHLKEIN